MGDIGLKRREKVTTACIRCRRRKIKCDGQIPCANCVKSKEPYCNYPDHLSPRRAPDNNTRHNTCRNGDDSEIEARLCRIERLVENLMERPGTDNKSNVDKTRRLSQQPGERTSAEHFQKDGWNTNFLKENACRESEETRIGCPLVRPSAEFYFGTHTTLYIFSEKSLDWIRSKLPKADQKLLNPLEDMSFFCEQFCENFSNTWVDPFSGNQESINTLEKFWERSTSFYKLLDYFEKDNLANNFCNKRQVITLIRKHLVEQKLEHERGATSSQLLIICVALALSISILIDDKVRDHPKNSEEDYLAMHIFEDHSLHEMILVQEALMRKSIFYFHRILVVSEGIDTIQGILLFIIFLESSWFEDSASYILTSIAVRYAQAMGLHKVESFYGLSEEEKETRKRIWRFCQYLDMEICYRFGKPPIISASEISSFSKKQAAADINFNLNETMEHSNDNDLIDQLYGNTSQEYCSDLLIQLTEIRAKSYAKLFSPNADYSNTSEFVSCVDELSDNMFAFSRSIDSRMAPKFYHDSNFGNLDALSDVSEEGYKPWYETLLVVHLTYFVHLMTINSVPFHLSGTDDHPFMEKNFDLAIDSARTILHMVRRVGGKRATFSCTNWLIFFPFAAFLTLLCKCIKFPSSPESFDDVHLLVEVSLKFFARNNRRFFVDKGNIKNFCQVQNFIDVLTRIMLSVLIRIMEVKANWETNQELRNYLNIDKDAYVKPFYGEGFKVRPTSDTQCASSNFAGSSFNIKEPATKKAKLPNNSLYLDGYKPPAFGTPRHSVYEDGEHCMADPQINNIVLPEDGGLGLYMDDAALDFQVPTKWEGLPNFFFD